MLYHISLILKNYITAFNVVHYISFRIMAALLTALVLSFIGGSWFIFFSQKFRSQVRNYTPEGHKLKNNTPTMGGLFVLITTIITGLLWCNLAKLEVWIFLLCLVGFALIGFWDDWRKITYKRGISGLTKFILQFVVSLTVVLLWYNLIYPDTNICIPFFKNIHLDIGLLLIPWAIFIIMGTSNGVNLTDGLDGLAIGSLIVNFATFTIICYIAGHYTFAHYLHIPFAHTAEIAILGSTLVGASLGFLWYNTYPAQIFMGDVGSLSFGAGLALMALMSRQELLLAISGGLFVAETLSVIAQVVSYKLFKKRVLKMAPLHHHYELLGWPEAKITMRFGIISVILCLISLMTLKLR